MKNARPQTSEASALDKHNDTPAPACTSCTVLDEVTRRLIDTIDRASLQIMAAILHAKSEPFGGPPIADAVRDAIEIRNQSIKAMNRGQS